MKGDGTACSTEGCSETQSSHVSPVFRLLLETKHGTHALGMQAVLKCSILYSSEGMAAECYAERCHKQRLVKGGLTEKQLRLRCNVYLQSTPVAVVCVGNPSARRKSEKGFRVREHMSTEAAKTSRSLVGAALGYMVE